MQRILFTVLGAVLTLSAPARAEGDADKGKELALEVCARCHVIGEENRMGGINSTPSFYIMAEKPESYSERIRTMQQRRPHASMELELTNEDLADVLSYVLTLERP